MSRFPLRLMALLFCGTCLSACASEMPTAAKLTGPTAKSASSDTNSTAANMDAEIRRAQLLRVDGHLTEATRALAQLMLIAPDDPRVVAEYGKVLAQQGDAQNAINFLNRAIELQGNDSTLYSTLGVAQDQLGNQEAARMSYEMSLRLKPGDAATLNNYALSRMLAGDTAGARTLMAQALGSNSDDPKIARNLALLENMTAGSPVAAAFGIQAPPSVAAAKPVAAPVVAAKAPAPAPFVSMPQPTNAPRPLPQPAAVAAAPTSVMQAVPRDELAGKVYGQKKPASKQAVAAAKPVTSKTAVASKTAVTKPVALKPAPVLSAPAKKAVVVDNKKKSIPKLRQTADISH